jgi:putative phosphoesterase
VELILHAGDVGGPEILAELATIAPVRAVWGNTDDTSDPDLVAALDLELGGLTVHVSHGHEVRRPSPEVLAATYAADIVVYGHTHRQRVDVVDGRLIVNPGAAGQRRFDITASLGILRIEAGQPDVTIIPLD